MNIEIPVFSGSSEERLTLIENFIVGFAEKLGSINCCVQGIERGKNYDTGDEIVITYSDGSRVRYLLTRL